MKKESRGVKAFAIVGGLIFAGVILYIVLAANDVFFDPVKAFDSQSIRYIHLMHNKDGLKPKPGDEEYSLSGEKIDTNFSRYKTAFINAYEASSKDVQARMIRLFRYQDDKDLEGAVLKTISQPYYHAQGNEYYLLIRDALDYLSFINDPGVDSAVFELLKGAASIAPGGQGKTDVEMFLERKDVLITAFEYFSARGNGEWTDKAIEIMKTYKEGLKQLADADPAMAEYCQRTSSHADQYIYSKVAARCVAYMNTTTLGTANTRTIQGGTSIDYTPGKVIVLHKEGLDNIAFNSLPESMRAAPDFEGIQTIFYIKEEEKGTPTYGEAIVCDTIISVIDKPHNALIATITVKPVIEGRSVRRGEQIRADNEDIERAIKCFLQLQPSSHLY